jgi:hypothetical protein
VAKVQAETARSPGLDPPVMISLLAGQIFLPGDVPKSGRAIFLLRRTTAIVHLKVAIVAGATAEDMAPSLDMVDKAIIRKDKTTPLNTLNIIRTNTHSKPVLLLTDQLTNVLFLISFRLILFCTFIVPFSGSFSCSSPSNRVRMIRYTTRTLVGI